MADRLVFYVYIGVKARDEDVSVVHKFIDYIKKVATKRIDSITVDLRAVQAPPANNLKWDEELQLYIDENGYPYGGLYDFNN